MDITPIIPEDLKVIDSYGPGRFQIGGDAYGGGVLVFPNQVLAWPVADFAAMTPSDLAVVKEADPPVEVLLVGTGHRTEFLRPSLKAEIKTIVGLGAEAMDTGAACRTYNILLSEGRRVAAALLPL